MGAGHFDYFYNSSKGEVNDKSSHFIEQLSEAIISKDSIAYNGLLAHDGIEFDNKTNTYTVDLSKNFEGHLD